MLSTGPSSSKLILLFSLYPFILGCQRATEEKQSAPPAPSTVTNVLTKPAINLSSYVLVIQTRPEIVEKLFQRQRAIYESCVQTLRNENRAAKPFPALPANFSLSRSTYAGDRKIRVFTRLIYIVEAAANLSESDCEFKLTRKWSRSIISGGIKRSAEQTEVGDAIVNPEEPAKEEGFPYYRVKEFSESKVFNGIALKCKFEICIIDPSTVWIEHEDYPVIALSRYANPEVWGTPLLREPVSLVLGKPISSTMLSLKNLR